MKTPTKTEVLSISCKKNNPKSKPMNYEEAKKKSDNLRTMIKNEYHFGDRLCVVTNVSAYEVENGSYEVVATGKDDIGYCFASVSDNTLKLKK